MKLIEVLCNLQPGSVVHHGNKNDSDFVEIFVLQDGSIRFADDLMTIDSNLISSDKWEKNDY